MSEPTAAPVGDPAAPLLAPSQDAQAQPSQQPPSSDDLSPTSKDAPLTPDVPKASETVPDDGNARVGDASPIHAHVSLRPTTSSENPSHHTLSAPSSSSEPIPSPSPAKRRPKPPTKGILKPPPPPAKPTLGNRLRDMVGGAVNTAVGTTSRLLDGTAEAGNASSGPSVNGATAGTSSGPSSSSSQSHGSGSQLIQSSSSAPGGTLASISGRLAGLGLSRFVATASAVTGVGSGSNSLGPSTPNGSPMPFRSISLPEVGSATGAAALIPGAGQLGSETSRQKQPLRRATFVLPSLSITYPISSQGEPWSAKVTEDRKRIESTHRTLLSASTGPEYWTSQRLVTLYESACRGREERPRVGIVRALEVIPSPPKSRHIHLILRPIDHTTIGVPPPPPPAPNTLDTPLTRYSAESLADVLSTEWGLMELKLEGGVLESEDALKPILHALLISGTLPVLGLAGNKKIKAGGWRLLAVFLKRARSLKYIDLSDTTWDKKSVEYIVQALTCAQVRAPPLAGSSKETEGEGPNESEEEGEKTIFSNYGSFMRPAPMLKGPDESRILAAVQTLRMDGCGLRAAVLETLAHGVRSSDLRNISLRRNKIGPLGAVALAIMIRDYPDSALGISSLSPSLSATTSITSPSPSIESTPNPTVPYAARVRRNHNSSPAPSPAAVERDLPPIPLVVSSATGGVTSRTLPEGYRPPPPPKHPLVMPGGGSSTIQDSGNFSIPISNLTAEGRMTSTELGGASMALQRSVRALDGVERIGKLLTLDLKSNEIRNGVNYIAQVLKRNRTLKVLNLSDNRIDPSGLTALAEALKYNSTLETLDLSSNPCCGPSGEGIAALRTAFTVNTSLKRLFLSDTGLTTDGAISLAEFLPESKSLLHLDLTANPAIDTAGILAISVGLKSNKLIRCLDISIPPNSPDLAELSQRILQCCIRNTELAAESLGNATNGSGNGSGTASKKSQIHASEAIWAPIKRSTLVRQAKEADQARAEQERLEVAQSPEGVAREFVYTLKPEKVIRVSEEVIHDINKWFGAAEYHGSVGREFRAWEPGQLPQDDFDVLYDRAKILRERIVDQIQDTVNSEHLERLLSLNDTLTSTLEQGSTFIPPPRLLLPSQIVASNPTNIDLSLSPSQPQSINTNAPQGGGRYASPLPGQRAFQSRRHMRISSTEISSPNFSIGDSDNDSDAEELDVGSFESRSTPTKPAVRSPSTNVGRPGQTQALTQAHSGDAGGLGLGPVGTETGGPLRVRTGSAERRGSSPSTSPGLLEKAEMEASPSTGLIPPASLLDSNSPSRSHSLSQGQEGESQGGPSSLTVPSSEGSGMDDLTSPTEKASRAWVEEEGEIFRKGMKLGVVDDEDEEEVSGEELRKEILETPVARSPTRRVIPVPSEGDRVGEDESEGRGEEDIYRGDEERA